MASYWDNKFKELQQRLNVKIESRNPANYTLDSSRTLDEQERLERARRQSDLVGGAVQDRALGAGGPSLASRQLLRGLYTAQKAAASQAASARGLNRASAQRGSLEAQAGLAADANANAAMIRAQEQIAAQQLAQQDAAGRRQTELEAWRIGSDESIAEMNARAQAVARAQAQANYDKEAQDRKNAAMMNAVATGGAAAANYVAQTQQGKPTTSAPSGSATGAAASAAKKPISSDRDAKTGIAMTQRLDEDVPFAPPAVPTMPQSAVPLSQAATAPAAPVYGDPNFAEKLAKAVNAQPLGSPYAAAQSGTDPSEESRRLASQPASGGSSGGGGGGAGIGSLVMGLAPLALAALSDRNAKTNVSAWTGSQSLPKRPKPVGSSVLDSQGAVADLTKDAVGAFMPEPPPARKVYANPKQFAGPQQASEWFQEPVYHEPEDLSRPMASSQYDWQNDPLAKMAPDPADTYSDPFRVPHMPDYGPQPPPVAVPDQPFGAAVKPGAAADLQKRAITSDMFSKEPIYSDKKAKELKTEVTALQNENAALRRGWTGAPSPAPRGDIGPIPPVSLLPYLRQMSQPKELPKPREKTEREQNWERRGGGDIGPPAPAHLLPYLKQKRLEYEAGQARGEAERAQAAFDAGAGRPPTPIVSDIRTKQPLYSDIRSKQIYSDKELKQAMTPDGASEAMDPIRPYTYRYKPEVAQRIGRDTAPRLGTMAQDMQKSTAYKSSVLDTPEGLALDKDRLLQANTAVVAGQDKRIDRLEAGLRALQRRRAV